MNKVEELQERIATLKVQLSMEADALAYVEYMDGQAYYDERRRFTMIREELYAKERELTALTVHTCHMPQHIATQRLRERFEERRKERLAGAMAQLEALFGGKK